MGTLRPVFSIPLCSAKMPDHVRVNAELRSFFVSREGKEFVNKDPYQVKSKELFESRFDLFDWPDPAIVNLKKFCYSHLYHMIGELNDYDRPTLERLKVRHESWFHVTRKGGYFGIHNHPLHTWSGVYCVCQEGDDGVDDSGVLTFINPNATSTMYIDMATFRYKPPYTANNLHLRMQPGDLVLFPSWLLHEVTPFQPVDSDALRITVAFNTRFILEGDLPP